MEKIKLNEVFGGQKRMTASLLAVVILLFAFVTFEGFTTLIYGGTLTLLMTEWGISPELSGVMGSASSIGMFIGAILVTWIADRIGRKKGVVICLLLFGLGAFLMAFATSVPYICAMRFLVGVGSGATTACAMSLVSEYTPNKNKGFILTIMAGGFMIGGVCANLLNLVLIPQYGWQGPYLFSLIPLIVLIPLIIAFVPESTKFYLAKGQKDKVLKTVKRFAPNVDIDEHTEFEFDMKTVNKVPIKDVFSNHRLVSTLVLWVVFFGCQFITYGVNNWLPSLVIESGFAFDSGLIFLLLVNLGGFVGAVGFSKLGDTIGMRKSICITLGITTVCLLLMMFVTGYIPVAILLTLLGAGFFGASTMLFSYSSLYYPADVRTVGAGLAGAAGRLGAIVGPAILGIFFGMHIGSVGLYGVIAIMAVIALVCMAFFVKDKYGSDV